MPAGEELLGLASQLSLLTFMPSRSDPDLSSYACQPSNLKPRGQNNQSESLMDVSWSPQGPSGLNGVRVGTVSCSLCMQIHVSNIVMGYQLESVW